ncbi:MAG TPA: GtrA family protein [Candidatus Eubacterium faecavium]|nr:GtrA family protein [Candidatus Eubacterium faecavium]
MKLKWLKTFAGKHAELWKFIKFNITVIITSALDICVYMVLLYYVFAPLNTQPLPESELLSFLGIRYKGYLFSYLISTTAGYVAAYIMNRKLTFHSDVNPVYSSVLYFMLALVNILVSSWLGSIVGTFMTKYSLSNPITEILSKFIIINIPTIWTYPLERYIIQIKRGKRRRISNDNSN